MKTFIKPVSAVGTHGAQAGIQAATILAVFSKIGREGLDNRGITPKDGNS